MKTAILTILFLPAFLSSFALAGAHEKLLGNWQIDMERLLKEPEFKEVIEYLDEDDLAELSNRSMTIYKEMIVLYEGESDGYKYLTPYPYKVTKDEGKTLTANLGELDEENPDEIDFDEALATFTLRDDHHIKLVFDEDDDEAIPYKRGKNTIKFPDRRLDLALTKGDLRKVAALLEQGSDPNGIHDYSVAPPTHGAVAQLNLDALKLLMKFGGDANCKKGKWISGYGNPSLLMGVLDDEARAFNLASYGGPRVPDPEKAYAEIVKLLLKNGADVNYINISFDGMKSTGMTALDTAKGTWSPNPKRARPDRYFNPDKKLKADMAALLVKHGAKTYEELSREWDGEKKIIGDWEIDMERMRKDPNHAESFKKKGAADKLSKTKLVITEEQVKSFCVFRNEHFSHHVRLKYKPCATSKDEVVLALDYGEVVKNHHVQINLKAVVLDKDHLSLQIIFASDHHDETEPERILHFKRRAAPWPEDLSEGQPRRRDACF